jgi:acyl-CoA synthetase (NDP forming)
MMNLRAILNAKSLAVVGASERAQGFNVMDNLRILGFRGHVYPVNTSHASILGQQCYPSLKELPKEARPDCVAIVVRADRVMGVLKDMADLNIKSAWALASGFAEIDEKGRKLQTELKEFCFSHDIAFCGPNCVGFANFHDRVAAYSAPLSDKVKVGGLGLVAHSGSVVLALTNSRTEIGFSTVISSGNEAVLDSVDYLNHLVDDEPTEVIAMFQEQLRRPEELKAACIRAAENNKPVVVLKIGSSDLARNTVASHTGALAGRQEVASAMLRKYGVIEVDDMDEMLEVSKLLAANRRRWPKGGRLGATTVSGGEIGLLGDHADRFGLSFPRLADETRNLAEGWLPAYVRPDNPMDAWSNGDLAGAYTNCLKAIARDPNVDVIVLSQDAPLAMSESQVAQYQDVARGAVLAAEETTDKPILMVSHVSGGLEPRITEILDGSDVAFIQGTRACMSAIRKMVDYASFRREDWPLLKTADRSSLTPPPFSGGRMLAGEGLISTALALDIIRYYGIQVTDGRLAGTPEEAVAAAAELGGPVALKLQSSEAPHKTEMGLLALNLQSRAEVLDAARNMENRLAGLGFTKECFWVQRMANVNSFEVIVGINNDPDYGPAVLLSLGGIFVELFKDPVLELAPFGVNDALKMIARMKQSAIFNGFRGRTALDIQELAECLSRVSLLAWDLRDSIGSLDLNPVMVGPKGRGVTVVDILMLPK